MSSDELDDERLLVDARTDRRGFTVFYRRHALAIYGWFAIHATRDPDTLDDLTAETFAQALLSLGRFRPLGDGSGSAWLFAIARNQQRQFHRRRHVSERARRRLGVPLDLGGVYDESEERVLAEQLRPALVAALDALPAEQRAAVELRVVHELDYSHVACRLGCSEQAARVRVFRGLRQLHAALVPPPLETP